MDLDPKSAGANQTGNPDDAREARPGESPTESGAESTGGGRTGIDNTGGAGETGNDPLPERSSVGMPNRGGSSEIAGNAADTGAEVGAAETGAAEASAAEAGGAAAGVAAAGGATAVAAEASGAAAGAAAGAGIGYVALIALIILLILIIIIGVAGFFTTMPQFLWNRLKEVATSIWDGIEGYVIGMDEALVNKDDIIFVGQYLYDMGYDLVGMGFAENVKIAGKKDEDGNLVPTDDKHPQNTIREIDAPFLRAYLVAENRTYLINNYTYNLKDFFNSFIDGSFFNEGHSVWGTGLIHLDRGLTDGLRMPFDAIRIGSLNLGELIDGVKIERKTNTLRIRRWNFSSGLAFWKWHRDYAYYSLAGWSGRYGKPFELMLTLHIATMAPDLVKEFAMNPDLDAKVNVKLLETTFNGTVLVDGKTIEQLEAEGTYDTDGTFIPTYDPSTIAALRNLQNDRASNIRTAIPYISSVTKHWFRNVYFEGTSSIGANADTDVGVDEDDDGLEDYNEPKGVKTQKTRKLSSDDNVYGFGEDGGEMEYVGDAIPGVTGKITFSGTFTDAAIQSKDAVRGVTNPKTKELFGKKYYIYDGSIAKAKAIQKARAAGDESIKDTIKFTKESLQAFTILETSETLDAQFIYRDLKELVIELGYFEREDFDVIEKKVLEWPIPDYIPGEWPVRDIEKQVIEYGTMIACDETVAYANGLTVEDVRQLAGLDKKNEGKERSYQDTLKRALFLGDSYFKNLKDANIIEDAYFYANDDSTPQDWIDDIATYPQYFGKVIIYLGLNNIEDYQAMENLLDAIREKYERKKIYVIEVMHLGKKYPDADKINAQIDTFNSHVRDKCKLMKDVRFIDASEGFITDGYLNNTSDGKHITDYTKWATNIAHEINDRTSQSSNATDEKFVLEFLKNAGILSKKLKNEGFTYGSVDYIPPQADGTTTEENQKYITNAGFVSWALYESGQRDMGEDGLTVGDKGNFISFCEGKKWKRVEDSSEVQAGDIIFTGKLDDDGKKARNVYIYAGDGQIYDVSSNDKIQAEQPQKMNIPSDFFCAYRVKGDGVMSTGFEKDKDVIAPGNGIIKTVYSDSTNIYTFNTISTRIDGKTAAATTDEVPGRNQTYQGIAIKLSDKALKGYILVMYGFQLEGVSEGQTIKVGDKIGKTLDSDIYLILIDRDKAVVEDVENYFKVPEKTSSGLRILDDYDVTDETNFVYDIGDFITMFEKYPNIVANAQAFLNMQDKYGISAVFAAAVTITESGGGTGWDLIDPSSHNWFSIKGSYNGNSWVDRNGTKWKSYPSFAAAIDDFGNLILNSSHYVKAGRVYVSEIGEVYCPTGDPPGKHWGDATNGHMTKAYEKII